MKFYPIKENPHFVGRRAEWQRLDEICQQETAHLIAVYGRRRVGKTELIEQYFRKTNVLKFEGIEIPFHDSRSFKERELFQIDQSLRRLSQYAENPMMARLSLKTWTEFFELLSQEIKKGKIVFYFEEIQWLASYQSNFFAEMKPFWDDQWRHLSGLTVILCGSSTSFILQQLLSDKALYGRVQEQFHLKPFTLMEIKTFLKQYGNKEVMLAGLSVGGICEYLHHLTGKGTILNRLCKQSFTPSSFFLNEYQKIFVSRLSSHKHYHSILEFLGQNKFATAQDITKKIRGNPKSGGSLTQILTDLEDCGFIEKVIPLHKREGSKLVRYTLDDEYLQWYYKFIKPKKKSIETGAFVSDPLKALNRRSFETVMGLNFERWCRKNVYLFAKIMEFAGVDYQAGSFFHKKTVGEAGLQIDLMYIIKGSKVILCEIKYTEGKIGSKIYDELRQKLETFQKMMPQYVHYTFETVLITPEGLKESRSQLSFDRVITFNDIFDPRYW